MSDISYQDLKPKEILESINDIRGKFFSYLTMAEQFFQLGERDKVVEYYEKAWEIAQEKQDKIMLSEIYSSYGIYYSNIHNTEKALKFLEYAKDLILEIGDKAKVAQLFTNMATIYIQNKDPQALKYAEDGLKLAIEAKVKTNEIQSLKTLGRAQALVAGDFDEGIKNIKRAIAIAKEKNFSVEWAVGLFVLGEVMIASNKTQQALKYLEQARKIFAEFNAKFHLEELENLLKNIS
jgi:tetratricopeptide (TPR) repeat protein